MSTAEDLRTIMLVVLRLMKMVLLLVMLEENHAFVRTVGQKTDARNPFLDNVKDTMQGDSGPGICPT